MTDTRNGDAAHSQLAQDDGAGVIAEGAIAMMAKGRTRRGRGKGEGGRGREWRGESKPAQEKKTRSMCVWVFIRHFVFFRTVILDDVLTYLPTYPPSGFSSKWNKHSIPTPTPRPTAAAVQKLIEARKGGGSGVPVKLSSTLWTKKKLRR